MIVVHPDDVVRFYQVVQSIGELGVDPPIAAEIATRILREVETVVQDPRFFNCLPSGLWQDRRRSRCSSAAAACYTDGHRAVDPTDLLPCFWTDHCWKIPV